MFVPLIQRYVLFLNVRVSYITFTATAVLPQITKPLARYYRGACPHTRKHRGVPRSMHPHYRGNTTVTYRGITDVPIPVQLSSTYALNACGYYHP